MSSKEYCRKYYIEHREERKKYFKEYYLKNKDKISKYHKIWVKNNREKINLYSRRQYWKDIAKSREVKRMRAYRRYHDIKKAFEEGVSK